MYSSHLQDMKAVKRMGRQILRGLQYLHSMEPPITHGDLRCDKIYVNGHSGEIKIGDLGLATLMPYRWDGSGPPPQQLPMDASSDIFAFGLCILELLTLKQLDPQHCAEWPMVVAEIQDEDARAFITKCLDPSRPDAEELLEDSFLCAKKTVPGEGGQGGNDLMMGPSLGASSKNLQDAIDAVKSDRKSADDIEEASDSVAVGRLRGEDYEFEFAGKVRGT
jgi:WNK lysine deficient protein kinase